MNLNDRLRNEDDDRAGAAVRSRPPRTEPSERNHDDGDTIALSTRRWPVNSLAGLPTRPSPTADANAIATPERDASVAGIIAESAEVSTNSMHLLAFLDRESTATDNAGGSPGKEAHDEHADDEHAAKEGGVEQAAVEGGSVEGGACAVAEEDTRENAGGNDCSWLETPRRPFGAPSLNLSLGGDAAPDEEGAADSPSAETPVSATAASVSSSSSEETEFHDGGRVRVGKGPLDAPSSPTIYDISALRRCPSWGASTATTAVPITTSEFNFNAGRFISSAAPISPSANYAATDSEYHVRDDLSLGERRRTPADGSVDDASAHVTLLPRVTRTTGTEHTAADAGRRSGPCLPHCPPSPSSSPLVFPNRSALCPMSPHQSFSHTHSLLDDCSDEEEEDEEEKGAPLFQVAVDSPTHQYGCLPRASSPFSYPRAKQQHNPGIGRRHGRHPSQTPAGTACSATQVATHNIHQALLQTRHRRWDCQAAYAGAHAQSDRVLDLSRRFYYLDRGYIPGERRARGASGGTTTLPLASRLSVSAAAVRAAALGSGLWRTARIVRLPRGLFQPHVSEMEEEGLAEARENEVRTLLRVIDATFSNLDQVDFDGDFSANNSGRNQTLSRILKYLPRVVLIDGVVVERDGIQLNAEFYSERAPEPAGHFNNASSFGNTLSERRRLETKHADATTCAEFESVANHAATSNTTAADGRGLHSPAQAITSDTRPDQYDTIDGSSVACGTSENLPTSTEEASATTGYPEDMQKIPALSMSSSMQSSSRSWGSNSSGTRPPTCPMSASRQRSLRLPSKPVARHKTKDGTSTKRRHGSYRRRILGLISMMDGDEDSDDLGETVGDDCPTGLL